MSEIIFLSDALKIHNTDINDDHLRAIDKKNVCNDTCSYWGYQCNINRMFEECKKQKY